MRSAISPVYILVFGQNFKELSYVEIFFEVFDINLNFSEINLLLYGSLWQLS